MENNAIYQRLKGVVGNYSIEELRAVTYQQTRELLDEHFTLGFWKNMKRAAMYYLTDKSDVATKNTLRDKLVGDKDVWLQNNFPNAVFEHGRELDKRFVKVWLDGKPEEVV